MRVIAKAVVAPFAEMGNQLRIRLSPIVIEVLAEMVALRLIRPGKAAGVGHSDRQESMAIRRHQEVAVLDDL